MKIIKGHDYYDSALAHGIDESLVFVRDRDQVEFYDEKIFDIQKKFIRANVKEYPDSHHWYNSYAEDFKRFEFQKNFYLMFCGKFYYGVHVNYYPLDKQKHINRSVPATDKFFWNDDDYNAFITEMTEYVPAKYNNTKLGHVPEFDKVTDKFLYDNKACIALCDVKYTGNEYASHLYYWKHRTNAGPKEIAKCHVNPSNLKAMEFYKVIDPYNAFQEISMYLSNMGAPGAPMVVLSEKSMLLKHGMDNTSFRKPKAG